MKACYLAQTLSIFLLNPIKLCPPINYFTVAVTKIWMSMIRKKSYLLHVPEEKDLTDFEMWGSGFNYSKLLLQSCDLCLLLEKG